jgi:hemerythrin superfamily protein
MFAQCGDGYQPDVSSPYLPPLPPLPGEGERVEYRPAGRSIISILTDEHLQLEALSAELVQAASARRDLANVVTAAVTKHLSAEEQYLYPAVEAVLPDGEGIVAEEIDHDTSILRKLAMLETMETPSKSFQELASSIDEDLMRHGSVCAEKIFPRLGELVSEADLIRLGNRVEIAAEAAPTRPHPDVPSRPPWNKIAAPAIGVIDRLRDSVERRKTFPEDLS